MPALKLLSYAETIAFPSLSELCTRLGMEEVRVDSVRKALAAVKKAPPDVILAEFVYAWGNNYASCHIGNLDSLLASVPKYAPRARVVVLAQPAEREHAERLAALYPLSGIATLPARAEELEALLCGDGPARPIATD